VISSHFLSIPESPSWWRDEAVERKIVEVSRVDFEEWFQRTTPGLLRWPTVLPAFRTGTSSRKIHRSLRPGVLFWARAGTSTAVNSVTKDWELFREHQTSRETTGDRLCHFKLPTTAHPSIGPDPRSSMSDFSPLLPYFCACFQSDSRVEERSPPCTTQRSKCVIDLQPASSVVRRPCCRSARTSCSFREHRSHGNDGTTDKPSRDWMTCVIDWRHADAHVSKRGQGVILLHPRGPNWNASRQKYRQSVDEKSDIEEQVGPMTVRPVSAT